NVDRLLDIKNKLDALESEEIWIQEKQKLIEKILLESLGIKAEFLAMKELAYPSEEVKTSLVMNNPSGIPIEISSFSLLEHNLPIAQPIQNNKAFNLDIPLKLPEDYPISQPYWLQEEPENNMYTIQAQSAIGSPFNQPSV